jgi:hypothetical protein
VRPSSSGGRISTAGLLEMIERYRELNAKKRAAGS